LLSSLLLPGVAHAADLDLLSPSTLSIAGDVRLVAATGEESWLDEGFGKLRASGLGNGRLRTKPELGSLDLIWQPRIGFAWSATIVGTVQGGERLEAGLSEAFISYKPMRGEKVRFAGRAGLMWPPVSLEHGGADWHVLDTVTPSAINSWIGEEVRPLAVEGTVGTQLGGHDFSGTVALFAANDTSAALLTLRGWALHDRRTLAFQRHPLPPLPEKLIGSQPQFTTPLLDVEQGFARRPGYYARLVWQLPVPVRLEAFHYDNRADPEAVNPALEWGWRTRFQNLGLIARPARGTTIKAQAMRGSTLMGFPDPVTLWIDTSFQSAFLLIAQEIGVGQLAARAEQFRTRNSGSYVRRRENEDGWAAALAYRRELSPNLTLVAEALHVRSDRDQRVLIGLPARQRQTQLQFVARAQW
jgi:hypothetical protein